MLIESGYNPLSIDELNDPIVEKFRDEGREISAEEGLITVGYRRQSAEPGGKQFIYIDRMQPMPKEAAFVPQDPHLVSL